MRPIAILLLIVLTACGTNRMRNPKKRKAIRETKVFDGLKPGSYKVVGSVEGVSCGKTWADHSSPEDAIQDMKANMIKVRADNDGITNVSCEKTGFSWANNCNNSYTCYGDVIKFNQSVQKESSRISKNLNKFIDTCSDKKPTNCYKASIILYRMGQLEDSIFYMQNACLVKFNDSCDVVKNLMKEKLARNNNDTQRRLAQEKKNRDRMNAENMSRMLMQKSFNDTIQKSTPSNVNVNLKADCESRRTYTGKVKTECK